MKSIRVSKLAEQDDDLEMHFPGISRQMDFGWPLEVQ